MRRVRDSGRTKSGSNIIVMAQPSPRFGRVLDGGESGDHTKAAVRHYKGWLAQTRLQTWRPTLDVGHPHAFLPWAETLLQHPNLRCQTANFVFLEVNLSKPLSQDSSRFRSLLLAGRSHIRSFIPRPCRPARGYPSWSGKYTKLRLKDCTSETIEHVRM